MCGRRLLAPGAGATARGPDTTEIAGVAGARPDQLETIEVKSAVETLEPTKVKLTVEVTYDELKPSIDHAYEHIAQDVVVPGFRKGKVPPRIIDQRVGRPARSSSTRSTRACPASTPRPSARTSCARWASPRSRSPRSPA